MATIITKTVNLNGVITRVTYHHDEHDDGAVSGFVNGQRRQRELGFSLTAKRGRRNMGSHPGWRLIEDRRAAARLIYTGFGKGVVTATKELLKKRYGSTQADRTRTPARVRNAG